jgi:hypothetical protein
MTISGIQNHYLRCPPVTIHPLKGPLVLPSEESGAFKLYALQWSFHDNHSKPSHWSIHPDHWVSVARQEIAPMSSPALKFIYGPVVYLFGYTIFPDLWLQARYRLTLRLASRTDSSAFLVVSHAHDLYTGVDWPYNEVGKIVRGPSFGGP